MPKTEESVRVRLDQSFRHSGFEGSPGGISVCGQWLGTTEAAGGPVVEKAPVLRTTLLSMSVSGPGGGGGASLLHPHDNLGNPGGETESERGQSAEVTGGRSPLPFPGRDLCLGPMASELYVLSLWQALLNDKCCPQGVACQVAGAVLEKAGDTGNPKGTGRITEGLFPILGSEVFC